MTCIPVSTRARRCLAPHPRSAAFTLTELLVCVAIIGVLAAILCAVLSSVRTSSEKARCLSNLRQIGTAAAAYSADHKQSSVPPAFLGALADYLPQQAIGPASPWFCPADSRQKTTTGNLTYNDPSYAYNGQRIGLPPTWWTTSQVRLPAIATPARTVYFSDAKAYYMNKAQANRNADFRHGGTLNALFFDGHVENLSFADTADFYDLL